jgi:hypothetical protein
VNGDMRNFLLRRIMLLTTYKLIAGICSAGPGRFVGVRQQQKCCRGDFHEQI